jgi:hypothetical protein
MKIFKQEKISKIERLKKLLTIYRMLALLFLFFSIVLFLLLVLSPKYSRPFIREVDSKRIIYEGNLTPEEKANAETILFSMKPEYLDTIRYITITNHTFMNDFEGMNFYGEIYIHYQDPITFKHILCHEVLHNIVNHFSDEWFVEDLNKNNPCYFNGT